MASNENQKSSIKNTKVLRFKNIPKKKEIVKKNPKKRLVNIPTELMQSSVVEKTKKAFIKEARLSEEINKAENNSHEVKNSLTISNGETRLKAFYEKKTKYSPNISRFITEKWFLLSLLSGVLLGSIIILSVIIHTRGEEKQILEQKRAIIQKEIIFWQENTRKYPGYRDAYFQLALLEYQLGNSQFSQDYLNKVISLDPNFDKARQLEKILKGS